VRARESASKRARDRVREGKETRFLFFYKKKRRNNSHPADIEAGGAPDKDALFVK